MRWEVETAPGGGATQHVHFDVDGFVVHAHNDVSNGDIRDGHVHDLPSQSHGARSLLAVMCVRVCVAATHPVCFRVVTSYAVEPDSPWSLGTSTAGSCSFMKEVTLALMLL